MELDRLTHVEQRSREAMSEQHHGRGRQRSDARKGFYEGVSQRFRSKLGETHSGFL